MNRAVRSNLAKPCLDHPLVERHITLFEQLERLGQPPHSIGQNRPLPVQGIQSLGLQFELFLFGNEHNGRQHHQACDEEEPSGIELKQRTGPLHTPSIGQKP